MPPAEGAGDEVFDHLPAEAWWTPGGALHTLHALNPARLTYLRGHVDLNGREVLDVGCGGGLLAVAMAAGGARVHGLDTSPAALAAARARSANGPCGDRLRWQQGSVQQHAREHEACYDVITCMEMLEHVAEPDGVVAACARLLRPGGHAFFSTLKRTPAAWLLAVVAAEYLLGLLPMGTHDYRRFLTPAELAELLQRHDLQLHDTCGLTYLPGLRRAVLTPTPHINYLAHARKP